MYYYPYLVIGSIYIVRSLGNPNLRKGELIEIAITEETRGNYEDALKAFAEIGKLARNHIVDLSSKERNVFYNCYHHYQKQLLDKLICPEKFLNEIVVQQLLGMYDTVKNIVRDLSEDVNGEVEQEYEGFFQKVSGDKAHCLAWYSDSTPVNVHALRGSITMYLKALDILERFLSDQELLLLDTYLRLSMAKMELDALSENMDSRACDNALKGIISGRASKSEGIAELENFLNIYCKDGSSNILEKYNFRRRNEV